LLLLCNSLIIICCWLLRCLAGFIQPPRPHLVIRKLLNY
jgi:hypothetical protein